jgi:uncharacterized protein YndB with AHSA1/START domain
MSTEHLATEMQVAVSDRALTFTRFLAAPRDRVFRAWTDADQLAQWWGPAGFTNPVSEVDLRPGGAYRIVMRAPDGREFPATGRYLEIEPPSRLVFTDTIEDEAPADWLAEFNQHRASSPGTPFTAQVTVLFDEVDGGTLLTIQNRFDSDSDRDAVVAMGATSGWSESLERLEALLAGA